MHKLVGRVSTVSLIPSLKIGFSIFTVVFLINCASFPLPNEVNVPKPINGTTGKYMCPYTSDGVVAPWVEKGIYAELGSKVGGYVGRKAGEKALEQIPLFGSYLGEKAGKTAGREAALALVGGRAYMRETSDLSFDKLNDMIVFLYANYSDNEHWPKVYKLVTGIYPSYPDKYTKAIKKARKK